ncbi:TIGR01777 family oxidoreductase [Weeksella virosa]|uniref:TIGR01777 family oxidoreductase n=1 Tax=Weeksella virosa TaxID=1014 RepID=UPI002555E0F8|nr:TIGR01777 family oxidoreductase [Weeksella virosa]MDK7374605.1 TIGR01777 family oxidoreductase [Weeksella virosa]
MKILVSGGTGFIGKALVEYLRLKAHEVRVLQRSYPKEDFYWDVEKNIFDEKAMHQIDGIIHLAGAPIAEPWTGYYQKVLYESRIDTANFLLEKAKDFCPDLSLFISASAIGFYGNEATDKTLTEESEAGEGFLSKLCVAWEAAADQFHEIGARVVKVRTPAVLSKDGGLIRVLNKVFRLGLGTNLGDGNNYMPWIHLQDLLRVYEFALINSSLDGAVNAVADEQITQNEFNLVLSREIKAPYFLPNIPEFVVKRILGERSALVLDGCLLSNMKLKNLGFRMQYPRIEEAMRTIFISEH